MQTLEALSRRIATTEDLQAIVRTMKSLSAVSIRQYESAVAALRDYSRTVELALQALLRDRPVVVDAAALAQAVLVQIDAWGAGEGLGRVLLIHHRRTGEAVAVPHMRQLLPLSPERWRNLAARPWPSRRRPMFTMAAERLFPAVIRQYLFSSVYRAAAESLASEHASRLASMQAAERSIEEHLEEQQAEFRRRRQETITEELLDLVTGFEAAR